ncbi:MAG: hypothetical protein Q8Q59_01255 [Luteolibacter sp.]|jgi:hypothetical protein|nr:hypothetical protein [Luteolibacter sp.]
MFEIESGNKSAKFLTGFYRFRFPKEGSTPVFRSGSLATLFPSVQPQIMGWFACFGGSPFLDQVNAGFHHGPPSTPWRAKKVIGHRRNLSGEEGGGKNSQTGSRIARHE